MNNNLIPPVICRQNAFTTNIEYNELEEVNIDEILYRNIPELIIGVEKYPVFPKIKRFLSDSVISPNINAKLPPTLHKFNSF